jgi:hypothetical protein
VRGFFDSAPGASWRWTDRIGAGAADEAIQAAAVTGDDHAAADREGGLTLTLTKAIVHCRRRGRPPLRAAAYRPCRRIVFSFALFAQYVILKYGCFLRGHHPSAANKKPPKGVAATTNVANTSLTHGS